LERLRAPNNQLCGDERGRAAAYAKLVPDRRYVSGLRFALQRAGERYGDAVSRIRKINRRDPEKRESDSIRGP